MENERKNKESAVQNEVSENVVTNCRTHPTLGVAMAYEDTLVYQQHLPNIPIAKGTLLYIISNIHTGDSEVLVPGKGAYWLSNKGWYTSFQFPQIKIDTDGKAVVA